MSLYPGDGSEVEAVDGSQYKNGSTIVAVLNMNGAQHIKPLLSVIQTKSSKMVGATTDKITCAEMMAKTEMMTKIAKLTQDPKALMIDVLKQVSQPAKM